MHLATHKTITLRYLLFYLILKQYCYFCMLQLPQLPFWMLRDGRYGLEVLKSNTVYSSVVKGKVLFKYYALLSDLNMVRMLWCLCFWFCMWYLDVWYCDSVSHGVFSFPGMSALLICPVDYSFFCKACLSIASFQLILCKLVRAWFYGYHV